jgi:hypothetical protein
MVRIHSLAFPSALVLTWLLAAGCGGDQESSGTAGTGGAGGTGGTGGGTTSATTTDSTSSSSSTTTTTTSGTNGMPSDVYPAPHPVPPKVVSSGGPVMKAPKIYPVFFDGDSPSATAAAKDLIDKIGASQFWADNTAEYGVGPATSAPPIVLSEMAPATIDDLSIQKWLADKLNADDPAFPKPDDNTLLAIYYPAGTQISFSGTQDVSCQSFGGYHFDIVLDAAHNNQRVVYAVMPRCPGFLPKTPVEDILTAATSHELIEAATDPLPDLDPAFTTTDDDHYYWTFAVGVAEIGDMCALNLSAYVNVPELGHLVQRAWSNKAAAAGHNPCVPQFPGEVYFNAAPVLPDELTINVGGQPVKVHGVQVPVGTSKTIEVDLFSDAKTKGPFKVSAYDYAALYGVGTPKLKFEFDKNTGVNGEKLNLTITAVQASKKGELIYLYSTLGSESNMWIGFLKN